MTPPAQDETLADALESLRVQTYEALLSNPEHIARIKAAQREIERVGGKLRIYPPNTGGLTLIELILPAGLRPEQLVSGVPFTLV
jgi:hypothetical protein